MTINPITGRQMTSYVECSHTGKFSPPPVKGDTVWCGYCRTWRTVREAVPAYHVRCRDCSLSRNFERGVKLKATKLVSTHRTKYPDHTVFLLDGLVLEHTFSPESTGQTALPFDDDTPPF